MKMPDAYRKARRMADEQQTSALVVTVDNGALPHAERFDAVTLDEYQNDGFCGRFFDFVAEVQP